MKLYAVSDLHLSSAANRLALARFDARPDDWLILAGDVGETEDHLNLAFDALQPRYAQLVWTPGNHELWRLPRSAPGGVERYERMAALCRARGVLTPEDPYPVVAFGGRAVRIAPLFTLFDYSFRPSDVAIEDVVLWAREEGIGSVDELRLDPAPYADRAAWCRARCAETERRLEAACADGLPTVLVNHWPLRARDVRLPRIPRFSPWCGTTRTQRWPSRYNACAVVYGHIHMRGVKRDAGVAYHEVSLGYPRDWEGRVEAKDCVRAILG
ncbi:metallophosphoesterase [Methylopila jiangsuensis]|uniref:Metallophosphoesterase n=1 Tax=Methylopila jiangsuensis TaxID=586230 RepID=A0A9W6N525_9HYPH|nr:metallophosphoesterase [Methylopila jiangsuensis]MDR6284661.1 3',5'-cyclic AMP phosphodiesterase CpdA [Methylopila jiangsuensis]GLK77950.1 metallophosphoesterase [Methylopila jiangsuensis]